MRLPGDDAACVRTVSALSARGVLSLIYTLFACHITCLGKSAIHDQIPLRTAPTAVLALRARSRHLPLKPPRCGAFLNNLGVGVSIHNHEACPEVASQLERSGPHSLTLGCRQA